MDHPFEFEQLMRYKTACENYKGGHDKDTVIADLKVLGEEWWNRGLVLYGYDATLKWLYPRFTPDEIAPMYYECRRDPLFLLEDGKRILKGAILSIVSDASLAAMSLPEAEWEIDGFEVGAIYPNKFYVRIKTGEHSSTSYHILTDGARYWVKDLPDIGSDSLEMTVGGLIRYLGPTVNYSR